MVRRAVDPLPLLLICIVVAATCYFLVPDDGWMERDHEAGKHPRPEFGCRKCYP